MHINSLIISFIELRFDVNKYPIFVGQEGLLARLDPQMFHEEGIVAWKLFNQWFVLDVMTLKFGLDSI